MCKDVPEEFKIKGKKRHSITHILKFQKVLALTWLKKNNEGVERSYPAKVQQIWASPKIRTQAT